MNESYESSEPYENRGREWFYSLHGNAQGPLSQSEIIERLRSGQVLSGTPVWYEGMSEWTPVENTELSPHLKYIAPPPVMGGYQTMPPASSNTLGGLIPTGNPKALLSYYIGLFSILCGVLMGPVAIFLGVHGLKLFREHPEVKGNIHSWVGIICGTISTLLWLFFLIGILTALSRTPGV